MIYLSCPRCETVTVSMPPAAPRWAHACLCLMDERTWNLPRLSALHRAQGQARSELGRCPVQAQRVVTFVAPYLQEVLSEADEEEQLEDCLVGLGLVLNVLLAGRLSKPPRVSMASLISRLCHTFEPLAQAPAGGFGTDRRSA